MNIKKLSFIVLALSLMSGLAFASYDEGAYIHNVERSKGSPADPTRVYMLVHYAVNGTSTAGLTEGDVVVWDCVSDDGVTVAITGSTSSVDAVAGVLVGNLPTSDTAGTAAQNIGNRNWGWIQTYGHCAKIKTLATVVAGQALKASSSTVGYAQGAENSINVRLFAFAYDAVATNGEAEGFIVNR